MKVVVAIDSFKGSATSSQLNNSVVKGIKSVLPACVVESFSIADGGEGTLEALYENLGGDFISVETIDLLERPIVAEYLIYKKMAFIESARVVGIDKISPSTETIAKATSYGLGALLLDAIAKGCEEIYIALGGTGSSDGGFGLLDSLHYNFQTYRLNQPDLLQNIKLVALADVTNGYAGPNGYSHVFGMQKGGSPKQLADMDALASSFVENVKFSSGLDLNAIAGTGAAGGLGGAIVLLDGSIQPGFETLARLIQLEESIMEADLIITGEGKLDGQSLGGKVPVSLAKMGRRYQVPTIAIAGTLDDSDESIEEMFLSTFSIQPGILSLDQAMQTDTTLKNIYRVTRNIFKTRYFND